jgi:hypothetical protein
MVSYHFLACREVVREGRFNLRSRPLKRWRGGRSLRRLKLLRRGWALRRGLRDCR